MFIFIAVIHIITSILLVAFVLLQSPKGGALGALGGQSSSKSVFGSTGASDFLVKSTKWCAIIFAITSIQLAYLSSKTEDSIILDGSTSQTPVQSQPADTTPSSQ